MRAKFAVVLPMFGSAKVNPLKVESVVANRIDATWREQYLVKWQVTPDGAERTPLSWHTVSELSNCLDLVQDYLDKRRLSRKRKAAELDNSHQEDAGDAVDDCRASSVFSSASESSAVHHVNDEIGAYNGVLFKDGDEICIRSASEAGVPQIDARVVPTPTMVLTSRSSTVSLARDKIRQQFIAQLGGNRGESVSFVNTRDTTTPPLRFRFINESIIGNDVYKQGPETLTGCEKCRPDMGQNIGCEYTQKCDCLEYAAPDKARLSEEQAERLELDQDTTGLPKRFPYRKDGILVAQYLDDRFPIYECNAKCRCGPHCKNRLVQHGRTVKLEIFKTRDRGWGIRTKEPLRRGRFIDRYLGEIITDAEATRREQAAAESKESYFYTLDKFRDRPELAEQDFYVVDGQDMGGITRFINHSCEPNCGQYAVSYNKHDWLTYELAFFAVRDIAAGEELTFDYIDKDDEVDDEGELKPSSIQVDGTAKERIPCRCGAPNCRKWLWM